MPGIDILGYCQSGCRHIVSYGGLAQTSVVVYCTIESESPNSITPYITFNGLTDDAESGPFRLKTSQNGVFIWGGSHTSRPNQRLQMVGEKSPSGGFVPFDGITPWKLNRYQQGNIWIRHINSEDGRKISAAPYTASAAWTLHVNWFFNLNLILCDGHLRSGMKSNWHHYGYSKKVYRRKCPTCSNCPH